MCPPLTLCALVCSPCPWELGPHPVLTLFPLHCPPLPIPEAPVTFVQVPQDLEVTEGDTATFECELSQALADVIWEKVRAQPQPSPPGHHNSKIAPN